MASSVTPRLFVACPKWWRAAVSSFWFKQGEPDEPSSVLTL